MMQLPEAKLFKFKLLNVERPKPSIFVTGPPGFGKTTLGYYLILEVLKREGKGEEDILTVEFPMDEEGAESLRDRKGPWVKIDSIAALDELYAHSLKLQAPGILMDNIPAAWWMSYMSRFPNGLMPDDFGRSWNQLFADIAYNTITRFKMHPWVKCFAATSLVWTTEDAFTVNQQSVATKGKDKVERLQATLPGQLKGNIYGLFSYCLNIKAGGNIKGKEMRILETRSNQSVVAKVRAPIREQPPASIMYDLADKDYGIEYVVKELKL